MANSQDNENETKRHAMAAILHCLVLKISLPWQRDAGTLGLLLRVHNMAAMTSVENWQKHHFSLVICFFFSSYKVAVLVIFTIVINNIIIVILLISR